jgi:VanZ family protein
MIKAIKTNILSIIVALIIMYLSLASSSTIDEVTFFTFPYEDKVVHFCMYFGLMITLLFEHRKTNTSFSGQILMAIIPFSYGITLELIQSYFTPDRSGEVLDGVANFSGVLVAVILWRLYLKTKKI